MKWKNVKEGTRANKFLTRGFIPWYCYATPSSRCLSIHNEYCFPVTKSFSGLSLTCHEGSATEAHAKSPGHLDATFTTEFPIKEGSSRSRTKPSSPLHTKPEGRRLADKRQRLKGNGTPRLQRWFTLEPCTRQQHLALSLSWSNLALTLSNLVLKSIDMITKHYGG
jgi:hypothetical protein